MDDGFVSFNTPYALAATLNDQDISGVTTAQEGMDQMSEKFRRWASRCMWTPSA
jgi:hypothetical protein